MFDSKPLDAKDNHLPKENARRFIRIFVRARDKNNDRHQRLRHRIWLLGAAGLVTSVTIASIPPREATLPPHLQEILATPPQILDIAPVSRMGDDHDKAVANPARRTKITPETISPPEPVWMEITVRRGETLSQILRRVGQEDSALLNSLHTQAEARAFYQLQPGQVLRLRTSVSGQLQELTTELEAGTTLHLRRTAQGFRVSREVLPLDIQPAYATGTIESSLFEDGLTAGLSEGLLLKLVEIFGWDIDFAQQLRRGDGFAVIYEEKFSQGQKVADGRILAAEFVNQGKTYRAIGFRDDRGRLEYHTPEGLSLRRPFLRTPVELSRISSRFAMRFHPVLKTWRAHTGVDYAAPTGTPVRATATGRVTALGWNGGYGQAVTLKHGGAFSTLYGHLSRFHPGLRVGSPIEQGQVIGYVGATGLATGPHLHYELQVNGRHQNPITFKFPGATPLAPEHKQAFLRNAGQFGTRLDLISRHNQVASSK